MGVCSPACAAQRASHLSQSTQLSVILFLSLEWKPNISPTSTERSSGRAPAHSEHLLCAARQPFGAFGLATDFFPKNFKILLVSPWVTPACPKGDHSWSGVVRIVLGQLWGRHQREPQALLCYRQSGLCPIASEAETRARFWPGLST